MNYMKETKHEISAEFSLGGSNLDYNVTTELLGIAPTRIRKKEDWYERISQSEFNMAQNLEAVSIWWVSTSPIIADTIDTSISQLLSLLDGKEAVINYLCNKYQLEACIEAVVFSNGGEHPTLGLEANAIKFLASINGSFGINLYINPDLDQI